MISMDTKQPIISFFNGIKKLKRDKLAMVKPESISNNIYIADWKGLNTLIY